MALSKASTRADEIIEGNLKTRPSTLKAQRGNALFVVVTIVTLLTAVGLFSMRAASLAEQAAGFNRLGTQTTYISEFAARTVASELVGKEQHYFRFISSGSDDCRANRQLAPLVAPNRPPCYKLEANELWERVDGEFPGNVGTSGDRDLFGELSRADVEGAFVVELVDLARVGSPVAGEDIAGDNFKHMQVTLSATAQVRPGSSTDESACDASLSAASSLQRLKARITFGPIN